MSLAKLSAPQPSSPVLTVALLCALRSVRNVSDLVDAQVDTSMPWYEHRLTKHRTANGAELEKKPHEFARLTVGGGGLGEGGGGSGEGEGGLGGGE